MWLQNKLCGASRVILDAFWWLGTDNGYVAFRYELKLKPKLKLINGSILLSRLDHLLLAASSLENTLLNCCSEQ
jgi:hypothetical protein